MIVEAFFCFRVDKEFIIIVVEDGMVTGPEDSTNSMIGRGEREFKEGYKERIIRARTPCSNDVSNCQ